MTWCADCAAEWLPTGSSPNQTVTIRGDTLRMCVPCWTAWIDAHPLCDHIANYGPGRCYLTAWHTGPHIAGEQS